MNISSAAERNSVITSKVTRQNREYVERIAFLEKELESNQKKPGGEDDKTSSLKRKLDESGIIPGDLTTKSEPPTDECQTAHATDLLPTPPKRSKVTTVKIEKSSENLEPFTESDQMFKPRKHISSAAELLDWLRASEKIDGERSFKVQHECSCWIVLVSTNESSNCPAKSRKKTFLFRKIKKARFVADHDVKLCKAEFKWANDDHETYHKAYRLQNCQGAVSFVGTPRHEEISAKPTKHEKKWKELVKKTDALEDFVHERDLKTFKKLIHFFDASKNMKQIEKMKLVKKEENERKMQRENQKGEEMGNSEDPPKNQVPLSEDKSQSSENFQLLNKSSEPIKPILSSTELLDWLRAGDNGRKTENQKQKSFLVLHECSCWIVFLATRPYKKFIPLHKRAQGFVFRKEKGQSVNEDHDEKLCKAELKIGKGADKTYRLQNCQGAVSVVDNKEMKKKWKTMAKKICDNQNNPLKKLGTFYGHKPEPLSEAQ